MTKEDVLNLLQAFRHLGLTMTAMINSVEGQEACLYQVARACGRPLREFLVEADPTEDPMLWSQAIQALEALREDQIWIRCALNGQSTPIDARWQ